MSSSLTIGRRLRTILLIASLNVTASNGCHGCCCGSKGGCTRAVSPHANCPMRRDVLSTAIVTGSYVDTSTCTATFVIVKLRRTRHITSTRPSVSTYFVCASRRKGLRAFLAGKVRGCVGWYTGTVGPSFVGCGVCHRCRACGDNGVVPVRHFPLRGGHYRRHGSGRDSCFLGRFRLRR